MKNVQDMNPWANRVPTSATWPKRAGLALLAVWFGGFGAWATLAPLDGAVVASGTFVATGQNKLVQHLEGGILRELLVGEGDEVARGQVLVKIDDTAAKAKLRRLVLKKYRLAIMQARLEAEMKGATSFVLPQALTTGDAELAAMLQRQST